MSISSASLRITHPRRRGLTLIELVVVMVILIALAGVLIPLFPSMLTRAHTSTTATNAAEASKAVQLYYNMYTGYPNNLDNLVAGTTIPSYVAAAATPYSGTPGSGGDLGVLTMTAGDPNITALNNAGITSVLNVIAAPLNPTFNPYSTTALTTAPTPTTLASGISVVQVNPTAVARELGINPVVTTTTSTGTPPVVTSTTTYGTYVLLGLGDYSTMSGKTMQEAPVHFDDSSGGQPTVVYGRLGLVFQTQDGTGTPLPQAKFIGTVDLADSDGITDASDHLQTYYQLK